MVEPRANKPVAVDSAQVSVRSAVGGREELAVADTVGADTVGAGTAGAGTAEVGIVGAGTAGAGTAGAGTAGAGIAGVVVRVDLPKLAAARDGIPVLLSLAELGLIDASLESDHRQGQSRLLGCCCYSLAEKFCRSPARGKRLTGFVLC